MPATARYQLVVGYEGYDAPRGPQNGPSHPWRTTRRHGIVRVERAPGVARDAASRLPTPEEREALQRAVLDAWEKGDASASTVGQRLGVTRSTVLGIVYRHRARTGTPSTPRATHAPRPPMHVDRDRDISTLLLTRSVARVAALYDLSVDTVRGVQRRARASGTLPSATVRVPRSAPVPAPATTVTCTSTGRVPLIDVRPDQCRSLSDDGTCCGSQVVAGRSWCPEHLARYTKSARRSA